jgi:HAD superfamily hydrolase (TIGR01509 family)
MRAAIFDFDGVIVDSERLHFQAMREALLLEHVAIDMQAYADHYLAYDDHNAIRLALERHGQPADRARVHALAARKAELFEALMPSIPFLPGARELVRALAREVPLAIASGARTSEIDRMLQAGGVRDAFTAIVGADDVRNFKPHPEPYLTALQQVSLRAPGLRGADCIAFEDSMPGIAAALAAGMKVVAVTNTYPAAKLSAAHRVVPSLLGVTPESLRSLFN